MEVDDMASWMTYEILHQQLLLHFHDHFILLQGV